MLYRLLDFYIVASRFYHRFWKTTYCFQVNALTMIGRSYTPNTGDRRHLAPFWVNEQLFNGVRQLDSSPYQYPKPPSMSQSVKRLGRCTASLRRTRVPWPFRSPSCCTMGLFRIDCCVILVSWLPPDVSSIHVCFWSLDLLFLVWSLVTVSDRVDGRNYYYFIYLALCPRRARNSC